VREPHAGTGAQGGTRTCGAPPLASLANDDGRLIPVKGAAEVWYSLGRANGGVVVVQVFALGRIRLRLTPRIEWCLGRFRAHLSAASTRRFHRLASQAGLKVVRPTGIEPMSARWHRAALPLSYGRPKLPGMVHRAGLEPAKPEGT
jgi:hypothetical protein